MQSWRFWLPSSSCLLSTHAVCSAVESGSQTRGTVDALGEPLKKYKAYTAPDHGIRTSGVGPKHCRYPGKLQREGSEPWYGGKESPRGLMIEAMEEKGRRRRCTVLASLAKHTRPSARRSGGSPGEMASPPVTSIVPTMQDLPLVGTPLFYLPKTLPQGRQIWVFLPFCRGGNWSWKMQNPCPKVGHLDGAKRAQPEDQKPPAREEPLVHRADSGPFPLPPLTRPSYIWPPSFPSELTSPSQGAPWCATCSPQQSTPPRFQAPQRKPCHLHHHAWSQSKIRAWVGSQAIPTNTPLPNQPLALRKGQKVSRPVLWTAPLSSLS